MVSTDGGNMHPDGISEYKKILRQQMIAQRKALSAGQREKAAEEVHKRLWSLMTSSVIVRQATIAVFAPFRDEIDISLVFTDLLRGGAKLCFPKIESDRGDRARPQIRFYRLPQQIKYNEWLQPGHFGVPEPPARYDPSSKQLVTRFDLMVVPGLAFDKHGNRLGWGKAYYDAYLAEMNEKPCLIGVGYDFQLLSDPLPTQKHDKPMDYIVTSAHIIRTE